MMPPVLPFQDPLLKFIYSSVNYTHNFAGLKTYIKEYTKLVPPALPSTRTRAQIDPQHWKSGFRSEYPLKSDGIVISSIHPVIHFICPLTAIYACLASSFESAKEN